MLGVTVDLRVCHGTSPPSRIRIRFRMKTPDLHTPSVAPRRFHAFPRFLVLLLLLLPSLVGAPAGAQVAGSIAVYPANTTVEEGGTKQYSAYVPISPNTITWSVNGVPGGNAMVGTISGSGLYTPPVPIPAANVVTIAATSTAFPASVGTATLKITRKYPWLWSVAPSSLPAGSYQVNFNGANFTPDSVAVGNGMDLTTTYVSPTKVVATGVAVAGTPIQFAVRKPGPGAITGNTVTAQVTAPTVTVAVSPNSASVGLGSSRAFAATVTGNPNTAVTWSVNGVQGGSPTLGTVSSAGLYTAPASMPGSATVTVRATSVASPASYGQATVTLTAPPPPAVVSVSPASASVTLGQSQAFNATVTGNPNTAVTWSVNGVQGGNATLGTISPAGLYAAPNSLPNPSTVTVRATSVATPSSFAQATVGLVLPPNDPPSPALLAAGRFLEQSSFGPSPTTLAAVQQSGIEAYLGQQFNLLETTIPMPAGNSLGALRQWMLHNYTSAPDQLRQRVAYSLSQIIVCSGAKLPYADEMIPWLRLLSKHAFGNYSNLLKEVTVSPSMGKYLDLANSTKPGVGLGANENYPRELMQLFSIGLWQLNQDGTQKTNALGQPLPTYSQTDVTQLALALTGWIYAPNPGGGGWEYFGGPMIPKPSNHATSAKTFLGVTLPAGQTVEQDLESVVAVLMQHPNIAPFVALRLIRSLVTSNPSGAYVQRVADVFVDNGAGVRGDLKAVVTAILLDPEARNDAATVQQGRLKEPILQVAGFLRALGGGFGAGQQITYLFDYMGQAVLAPPSVFSWFSPLYRVPKSPLFGPEFQIYSPTEAVLRGNLIHSILAYPGADMPVDLAPFQAYANNLPGLVEAVNVRFLYGRLPAEAKQAILTAAQPGYDFKTRLDTVLYLTALTGQYAVQH